MQTNNEAVNSTASDLLAEYKVTDPELNINVLDTYYPSHALPEDVQNALLCAIQACPVGIHRMSPDIEGLVQTSNNLARVKVEEGSVNIQCLNRSSVDSEKWDHARSIEGAFALAGLSTEQGGAYPGWTPNPSSAAVEMLRSLYVEKYGEEPRVLACHAGLECGILGQITLIWIWRHLDQISEELTVLTNVYRLVLLRSFGISY